MKIALSVASAALSAIGFLFLLFGIIMGLTVNNHNDLEEVIFPITMIAGGIGMAIIPWCLSDLVFKFLDMKGELVEPEVS